MPLFPPPPPRPPVQPIERTAPYVLNGWLVLDDAECGNMIPLSLVTFVVENDEGGTDISTNNEEYISVTHSYRAVRDAILAGSR